MGLAHLLEGRRRQLREGHVQAVLLRGARGRDLAVRVEHALAGARGDEEGHRVRVPEDVCRQVHVRVADAVEHRMPELDVGVGFDRAAERSLVVGAAGEVAVDHRVRADLRRLLEVVDVRRELDATV